MVAENQHGSIIIREGTAEDITSCVNAFSLMLDEIESFPENDLINSGYNVALFRDLLRISISNGYCPIIAESEGSLVGVSFFMKFFGFETKDVIVQALGTYVYPKYRHNGLSKKLIEFGFNLYKSKGVDKVLGKVFESRNNANTVIKDLKLEEITVLCRTLS